MGLLWEVGTNGSVKGYGIHENLLSNGGMEVDQANSGATYTNPANGAETLDSWLVAKTGSTLPQVNINRAAIGDLGAQIDTGNYAMKIVVTNAGTADAVFAMNQTLDHKSFLGITLSLSARIYSSLSSATRISIDDGVSESFSLYHPGGGVYQTLNVTKIVSTSATYLKINVFKMIAGEVQIGSYFADSAMMVVGLFPVPFRQKTVDYDINGQRLTAGSVKQDRINLSSFSGSGIGFNQTGTVQVFYMASPPSGWTQVVSLNDRHLRIVSGAGGGTGGSSSPSAGISLSHGHVGNNHTHTVNSHTHTENNHTHGVNSHSHTISHQHETAQGLSGAQIFFPTNGGANSWPHGFVTRSYNYWVQGVAGIAVAAPIPYYLTAGSDTANSGADSPGTGNQSDTGMSSALGTYVFQYCDIIFASKN